jgi:predicted trehalose synthase
VRAWPTCAAEAGGDFAAESHRLGAATVEIHRQLAAEVEHLIEREVVSVNRELDRLSGQGASWIGYPAKAA